jgi:hypothetical protein
MTEACGAHRESRSHEWDFRGSRSHEWDFRARPGSKVDGSFVAMGIASGRAGEAS